MKTYEQRGHKNNAGDVYTYDDVYRLNNVKIDVPDSTISNPTEFEKEKTFTDAGGEVASKSTIGNTLLFYGLFNSKGIPLPLEATIVHEFGHTNGLLKGYKMKEHTSMNAEIAVLLENLYRLRTSLRDYSLRKYH